MHVLQLLPSLEVGGVERGVVDLSKGLIERAHRVSVVSSGGALVEPLTQLGAMHYQLPVHEKSPKTIWSCIQAVTQLIRSTDVDIVHARSRVPGWIGFAAARRAQRPFVTTAHGFYAPHLGSRVMVWGRLVIAPSAALGRHLVEQCHLPRARLRVIPRGVDLKTFAFQPLSRAHEGTWRIGLFGRLSPLKGHEVALRACERLVRRGIPVKLCIAGDVPDTPLKRSLESLIQRLKLGETVEWLGVRHDIPSLIASVDLVVVPSIYPESFGRSVIEAQAVGRPVVASRIGALLELIEDERTGLLVPHSDPKALADAIARFISDGSLRARCVEESRERIEAQWGLDRMVEQTLSVYDECLTRPNILIWKLSALGDVILSTPSLRAIRRQFPKGRLTLVVGRAAYEVVARCPYLDDIIVHNPGRLGKRLWSFLRLLARLRAGAFDLSIDLQNSRKTHMLAWLAAVPVRIGYRRKYGWLLNRGVRLPRVVLAPIAHQHYLLQHAGISTDGEDLELWPSALEEQAAQRLLGESYADKSQHLVGLHPGGSLRWKTKRWDLERWARLCDALGQRNIRVVITGSSCELGLGETLLRLASSKPLVVIGQTSLMELACLIKRCDTFVTHDSSPLHLAASMRTPTIALFGPTDPKRHLPPTFVGQVIKKDLFCSPCYSRHCRTVTHACMKRISVEEVLSAVLGALADTESVKQNVA
jgi:lipopolysaccharide heptosyltransferase II